MKKRVRTSTSVIRSFDDADEPIELTIRLQAIGSAAYDELVSAHPPTEKQRRDGAVYNVDTFAPALIATVSVEPKLSYEQARDIYTNPDWSAGEIGGLFIDALKLCNAGLDIPFNERD